MEKDSADLSSMSFEEALQELEIIVRKLEEGKINLEDAIDSYERGAQLKRYCNSKLHHARTRVDQIISKADGQISIKPFEKEESTDY